MKLFSKILLLGLGAGLFLTSCEKEESYAKAPAAAQDSTIVYFTEHPTVYILSITDNAFTVLVSRHDSVEAASYGVHASIPAPYEKLFTVPETVNFNVNCADTTLTIGVGDMELMKNYSFAIALDSKVANPYKVSTDYTTLVINVKKEDFAPYANGIYSTSFFGAQWEATLEYSPSTELYRFKNCWMDGYDVSFYWTNKEEDGKKVYTVEMSKEAFVTGYVHSEYGMVTAYYGAANADADPSYDSAKQEFTFPIKWRVSAGSFGIENDTYTITEFVE